MATKSTAATKKAPAKKAPAKKPAALEKEVESPPAISYQDLLDARKPSTWIGEFVLYFGSQRVSGKLIGIIKNEPSLKLCTPDGKRVHQRYIDDAENLYEPSELHRARERTVNGEKVLDYIGKENVKEAKESDLPLNILHVRPYTLQSTHNLVVPAKAGIYVLEPDTKDPANIASYGFLLAALSNENAVFLGCANLQNSEGFFKVYVWNGNIVVHKHCFPEDVFEFEPSPYVADATIQAKADAIVAKHVAEFEPSDFRSAKAEKLAQVLSGEYTPGESVAKSDSKEIDLLDALDNFEL